MFAPVLPRVALLLAVAAVCSIGCDAPSKAQTESSPATAAKDDAAKNDAPPAGVAADAKQALADWYGALTAAKSLTADTAAKFAVLQAGQEVQAQGETFRLAVERPDRFAVRLVNGDSYSIVNDGKRLYQLNHEKAVYTLGEPFQLADLAKSVVLSRTHAQQGLELVADALAGVALDKILEGYESVALVGTEEVDGRKQRHLRAKHRDGGMQVDWWFDAEKPFALRKIQPDAAEIYRRNSGQEAPAGIELRLTVTFDAVKYDAPVPADAFEIKPPAEAGQVENIDDYPAVALRGKPAPTFEATMLDGSTFKLADQKGKIVVLDFWATWCPPCVAGLPKLAEMTAKHKDDGVVFFPINIQEEPSIIKEFLAAKELKLPIVLEQGQEILKKFKVGPVPQTVFIDREGVVQIVHVGIGELEQIPEQLKGLVAGKNFAKSETAKPE